MNKFLFYTEKFEKKTFFFLLFKCFITILKYSVSFDLSRLLRNINDVM